MLILASQSPRRQELLRAAGIPFAVQPSGVEERREPGETPALYVKRLAQHKAEAAKAGPEDVVLGADTVVVLDGEILEKPRDEGDARNMLRRLSGREHIVITGVCLRRGDLLWVEAVETRVVFAKLSEREIAWYVASGEPRDKAGAYAIQGLASRFVTEVRGCYANVVGLPVSRVYWMLTDLGISV